MTYVVTTLDTLMGSPLSIPEHWVHRKDSSIREYQCGSRAEAEYLCEMLNLTTEAQRSEALRRVCEPKRRKKHAA